MYDGQANNDLEDNEHLIFVVGVFSQLDSPPDDVLIPLECRHMKRHVVQLVSSARQTSTARKGSEAEE